MTMDLEDPFALPSESKVAARTDVLSRGRYMLPWKDGRHKTRGFMRVSNLVSAYSDQFGLRMWEIEQTLRGVAAAPTLYASILATMTGAAWEHRSKDERKEWVADFIEHAKEAARANEGSKFGNQRHAVVEAYHAGLPLGHASADTRRHLSLYASALVRNKLRALDGMQERRVLVESLEVVGTWDNVLEDLNTGHLHIGDLKTQKKFWTFLEIAAQLATYAHGDALWNVERGVWEDIPPLDPDLGLVLWMPREPEDEEERKAWEPHVDVYEVDIRAGWETAKRAFEVVKDRAAAKAAKNPRGWVRAAPTVTDTERMAARFAAAETLAEGRALVAEAKTKGLWCPALADTAAAAKTRISFPA